MSKEDCRGRFQKLRDVLTGKHVPVPSNQEASESLYEKYERHMQTVLQEIRHLGIQPNRQEQMLWASYPQTALPVDKLPRLPAHWEQITTNRILVNLSLMAHSQNRHFSEAGEKITQLLLDGNLIIHP